ncbi:hypothetical protein A3D42_01025 [Candidatus Nomurabacteria bacterium RIFCSPHIGHO2_02_FULL_41_18]|uniref:Uncharacterized protein n=1 Tax=Candidatus Nomurabacteria bacterium RIFCSPHIGHO2_02_FULL_41_18 TaxID=1801754 RepID=A0A1F6W6Y7_9BACT|nr:MAG: hypothetical protein A2737_03230 [Candidatus Nomurabacteria bacterium RIFCSPHIGHO2_01_FULL_41_71]OGI77562.1 MAG: hypothetical protein A3D42_01025 [Candidatus Nomurabacteria bacterium RIFCSPHIGHO2_02_FULL_41_18]OGI89062.1 MAG: hypothetical protein A3B01_00605 [Candidatus Nomurabacteria bacterium RIFCSPLOWO2_01_FULL_41_52b]OGJ00437.1 MAG: hypothetical protein A3I90_00940 [Candidatus Nomurabacteria bacterium RIFCSPLOWO2_02_FULL_41_9]
MNFEYGTTRFVFCVGGVAMKVARVKVIYWAKRVIEKIFVAQHATNILRGGNPQPFARLRHLFAGVTANLEEGRMYARYPELPLAPTLFSFFGLVNIQVRGTPIGKDELVLCPFRDLADIESAGIDLNKAENFGRIDGRIVLLDCGFEGLNKILARYAESRQIVYDF